MILALGGFVGALTNNDYFAMQWVVVICSWSPTIVLFALSKKILKGITLKSFYKNTFRDKVSLSSFFFSTLIIVGIYLLSVVLCGFIISDSFMLNISISFPAIIYSLIFSVLQGASGEESGWRGYLCPILVEKCGFSKGNIILGLIWTFWHLPLWFLSSGYSGWMLLQYIVAFILCIVSFSILIGWVQLRCRNLFLAFWMHFLFNFVLTTCSIDILTPITIMSVCYFIIAVIIVVKEKNDAS